MQCEAGRGIFCCQEAEEEAAQKVVPLVQGCSSPCSYTVSLLPALFFSVHCW